MKPEEFERIVVQDREILKKIIAEAKIKAE